MSFPNTLFISFWIASFQVPSAFAGQNSPDDVVVGGFSLGNASLKDVQKIAGDAQIEKKGDAGEAFDSICIEAADSHFIVFGSSEMGGSSKLLTEATISLEAPKSRTCTRTQINSTLQVRGNDVSFGSAGALKKVIKGFKWKKTDFGAKGESLRKVTRKGWKNPFGLAITFYLKYKDEA